MRLSRIVLICLCFLLVLAVSCSDSGSANPSEVSIDASSQTDQWFPAGRNTSISITSMDPTVLYAVKTKKGGSRSLSARDSESSDSILTTESGTNIPIPDEDCSCNFIGSDVHITTQDDIQIVELKAGTDMTLHASGEPDYIAENGDRVWEEYYYVDLTQPPYNFTPDELKRMTVFTKHTGSGSGGSNWAMVSTNFSAIVDETSGMFGAFDISEHEGVIIYSQICIKSGTDWTQRVYLRPTTLMSCDSSVTAINESYEVLQVDTSTASADKEYVLVMKKYEEGAYLLEQHSAEMTRFLDGTSRGFAIPISSDEADASVIYLGKIDPSRDFLIDFPIYNTDEEQRHYADVYIREISDYEKNMGRIMLTSEDDMEFTIDVPANAGRFKYPLLVGAEGDDNNLKNNLIVSVECNELEGGIKGDYYGRGYTEVYMNMSHSYSVGMSGKAMYGSYSSSVVTDTNYLETLCLYANYSAKPLRFTIHIKRSDEPIREDGFDPSYWKLTIVPNNGGEIRTENVPTLEPHGVAKYTAPAAPSRPGYEFVGWGIGGSVYQPGDQIDIYFENVLVAIWNPL